MEGGSRFRKPLTAEEERLLVASTIPKNTGYNTKWAVKVFEEVAEKLGMCLEVQ